VAALRAARQAHASPATRLPQRQQCADGCEVAAEPLGDPSHFPVGADVDFRRPIAPMISFLTLSNDLVDTFLPFTLCTFSFLTRFSRITEHTIDNVALL
jgi:hypothetical protein